MKVYNDSVLELNDELTRLLNKYRDKRGSNIFLSEYLRKKSKALNDYMIKFGLTACVIGVSGGIDSAVTLGILKYASKQSNSPIRKIQPLLLPSYNDEGVTGQQGATGRGKVVCKSLGLSPIEINLSPITNIVTNHFDNNLLGKGTNWAKGQLAPLMRTPILYNATSRLNEDGYKALVIGTINRSEGSYIGYIGKASDYMVDLQLITDLYKSEVYELARMLKLPKEVLDITPTGDMYDGRSDEEVFGVSYDALELCLELINTQKADKDSDIAVMSKKSKLLLELMLDRVDKIHSYNSHKYNVGSPAIHLDLIDTRIKNGWNKDTVKELARIMKK